MSTKVLLSATALLFGLPGLFLLFAPDVILVSLGEPVAKVPLLMCQLAGAMAFAMAVNNWMARGAAIGGIYGRPLLVANLAAMLTCGFSLVNAEALAHGPAPTVVGVVFLLFAAAFGRLMFAGPKP
jgi:hypothetical protein